MLHDYADDDPGWHLLVSCMLLNQTGRPAVDRIWPTLFELYPTAKRMALARSRLLDLLRPLGLQQRRFNTLRNFSSQWFRAGHGSQDRDSDVMEMLYYGVGEYARDSWMIFMRMEEPKQEVGDKELRAFLQLYRKSNASSLSSFIKQREREQRGTHRTDTVPATMQYEELRG